MFVLGLFSFNTPSCPADFLFQDENGFYRLDRKGNLEPLLVDFEGDVYVSPSGKLFAVIVEDQDQSAIMIFDAQGKIASERVICSGLCRHITWSPDETRLSYEDFGELQYQGQVYLINHDGTNAQKILDTQTFTTGGLVNFAWSADGQTIAYELLTPSVGRAIFLYDVIAQTHQPLFPESDFENVFYSLVGWRSDGDYLLFNTIYENSGDERSGLYQMDMTNGSLIYISPQFAYTFAESRQGDLIALMMMDQSYEVIHIWDHLTNDIQPITQRGDLVFDGGGRLFWSPIDDKLYISGLLRTYSIQPNGEELTQLEGLEGHIISFLPCDSLD